jgi:hypothetical protein
MLAKSRFLLAVGVLAVTSAAAPAQFTMPKVDTRPIPWTPQYQNQAFPWQQKQQPNQPQKGNQPKNQVFAMPSINTMPGIPASRIFPPVSQNPTWLDPTLTAQNTWMNLPNARPNPFLMNPMFNNPFAINPLLQQAAWFNQFNMPYYRPQTSLSDWGPVAPVVSYSPPIAVREPGQYIYKGFDLQVNPATGTDYRPQSGVVTRADGTTFYRVPGTGQPSVNGFYATGTGTYYNPDGGTYFNPSSGIISKPAQANVFMPYVW